MTIHTKWMELLRSEASDAFQYGELNGKPSASFIDGQIKLMKPESVQTWADFLYAKFTSVIMRHFELYGCSTVVLSFDDKRHVPKAKAITQCKRRAGVQTIDFGEADTLPNDLPLQWKESIMNAWFKHRVIELICANIPRLVAPTGRKRLIVDWETVTEYIYNSDGTDPEIAPHDCTGIGEADLKFTHWMRKFECPMLIEATDGDYIPIALGLKVAGHGQPVVILKAWNQEKGGAEFVHIDLIHSFLKKRFARAGSTEEWEEIKIFIALLGLSGTDFTRNLPLVSPQKIWGALSIVTRTFSMDGPTTLNLQKGKRVVELLYAEAFPKHIDPFSRRSVWSQVGFFLHPLFGQKPILTSKNQAQDSKLGARNKALIPTDARIECTLRNINFLMAYWLEFQPPKNIENYGFRITEDGVVQWDD